MTRKTRSILSLVALFLAGLSCDSPTGPRTGSIRLVLLSETGLPLSISERVDDGSLLTPNVRATEGTRPNITLTSVKVTVTGPTSRTVTSSVANGANFDVVIDQLDPGTYAVSVEGLVNGQVAHFGQTAGVSVQAGRSASAGVTFPVFQPIIPNATVVDTVDVLRFTVSYGAVTGATGYRVDWSTSPTMSGATSVNVAGTSTEIVVPLEGQYYVTVRAINPAATSGGLPSPTKGVFVFQGVATVTVTPATPTIAAGATQAMTAVARDGDGVIVPGVTLFWASSNQAVALVSQAGVATGVAGGSATITAIAKGTPGSAVVAVTPRPAAKLAFVGQPGNAAAGQTIPTVQVAVLDALGATVSTDNSTQITVAIGSDAGPGGALAGLQTVSVIAGVATFANLSIAKSGAGYTIAAAATALTGTTSANFNVTTGTATLLAFTVQPSNTSAGVPLSPAVQATVQDALGNRVTTASTAVTIAIGTNPGSGTLSGTAVVNAINGVASFSGLSIAPGGSGYTLTAAGSGLTTATSAPFNVTAVLPASQLVFSIPPANAGAGEPLSPAVQVEIRDGAGNRVTTARDAVTIAFSVNAGSGTLTGTKTVNAINGIASFSGISINKSAIGYSLAATAGGLTAATSPTFNISPAAPSKLAFNTLAATASGNIAIGGGVSVRVLDAFDNLVDTATTSVTLAIDNNPFRTVFGGGGTLSATQLSAASVAGVASFANVRIDKAATGYTLGATSSATSAATSSALNVTVNYNGAVSAGTSSSHSCAVSATSGTYCWGYNGQGQLGVPSATANMDSTPALVRGGLTFALVSVGSNHSCALTAAGAAYCWGYGQGGRLGNGSNADSDVPVAVSGGHVFTALDAGAYHTCGVTSANGTLTEDRQVWCWGDNGNGQLGDGSFTTSNIPVRAPIVVSLATWRVAAISAGQSHSCVVTVNAAPSNGAALCWGYGGNGQLGDGFTISRPTPGIVNGGYVWTSISAGANNSCGIAAGVARCWGYGGNGQNGDGTNTQLSSPGTVAGAISSWTRLTAGDSHSCGINALGTFCWGYNGSGQLGDDSPTGASSNTPVPVAGGLTFLTVDAGSSHSCGRTAAAVFCWGYSGNGQVGSGTVNKRAPTRIVQ